MVASPRRFVGSLCVHACTHPVLVASAHNTLAAQRFHESRISLRRERKKKKKRKKVRSLFEIYGTVDCSGIK